MKSLIILFSKKTKTATGWAFWKPEQEPRFPCFLVIFLRCVTQNQDKGLGQDIAAIRAEFCHHLAAQNQNKLNPVVLPWRLWILCNQNKISTRLSLALTDLHESRLT